MDTILTLDRLFHFKVKLLVLCHVIGLSTSYFFSNWIAPPQPLLPRPVYAMAICHLNNSIILLGGGHENDFQMLFYNISNNSITDYGTLPHNMSAFGHGDYYTQINHMLYWIEPFRSNINYIIAYNIINNTLKATTPMETFITNGACLTSINNTLFVLGGKSQAGDPLNSTQIFNLSSHTWWDSLEIPNMIWPRSHHTCIVDPLYNKLYVIGGDLGRFVRISAFVEVISIDNILNQAWKVSEHLIYPTMSTRAVIYHNTILIIGGLYTDPDTLKLDISSEIQVIDRKTGSVSIGGHLNYGVATTSIVIVNDIIYAFGGSNITHPPAGVNTWQYLKVDRQTDPKNNKSIFIGFGLIGAVLLLIGMWWCCSQTRTARNVALDNLDSNSMQTNEFSEMLQK
eukprot:194914_1